MRFFKPFTPEQAASRFDRYFHKLQAGKPDRPLQALIFSPKLGLDYSYPSGSTGQPYHTASIGKLFTAVLVQLLAGRGQLALRDPLNRWLPAALLDGLFVYQGSDHTGEVTLEHLLGHTSGIADYFEGATSSGKSFTSEILAHPETRWTPETLLDFTRRNQTAAGIPGQVFNYSDSGYILLGLVIEAVTGKSFGENLVDEIFVPLGMEDTSLMFHTHPANPNPKALEKIWFDGVEISSYASLSCDWAGGGIVSTSGDLLKFNQALRRGRLIQPDALAHMDACSRKFRPGIYYGLGMMEIRFGEFFFLLGRLPRLKGHIGVLATHLFYDPIREAHIILNFGDNTRMVESFKALIEIENTLQRMRNED